MLRALRRRREAREVRELILVTDPGPDPDDVKAILIVGTLHRRGDTRLRLVVANGGHQARQRARLARCVLDAIGVRAVPVAIGSEGKPYEPVAHEYALDGYEAVDESRLEADGHGAMVRALESARPKSVTVVCISSLRDLADVLSARPELALEKLERVAVQAGVEFDPRVGKWVPDTSVNNGFDPEAAAAVYDFCFGRGLPLTVVSRHAVPLLPMQLARSFAERTASPLMAYLANAQFLGLEGLWRKLCEGKLPARCSKQWYFETFCGVGAKTFAAKRYAELDAHTAIVRYLNGYVKPYDVLALMAVLPGRPGHAFARCQRADAKLPPSAPPAAHALHLSPEHAIDVAHVIGLLRHVYHDIVLSTSASSAAGVNPQLASERQLDRAELRVSKGAAFTSALTRGSRSRTRGSGPAHPPLRDAGGDNRLPSGAIIELLDGSVHAARAQLQHVTRVTAGFCALGCMVGVPVYLWAARQPPPPPDDLQRAAALHAIGLSGLGLTVVSFCLGRLALQPIASHMRATAAFAAGGVAAVLLYMASAVQLGLAQLERSPAAFFFCAAGQPGAMYTVSAGLIFALVGVALALTLYLAHVFMRTAGRPPLLAQPARLRALRTFALVAMSAGVLPLAALIGARCVLERASGVAQAAMVVPYTLTIIPVVICLCYALLLPATAARAEALFARCARGRAAGLACTLAPLVGYGAADRLEPALLVPEALRSVAVARLDGPTLRALVLPTAASSDGRPSGGSDDDSSSARGLSPGWPQRRGRRRHRRAPGSAASRILPTPDARRSTVVIDLSDERVRAPERIDAFVVHARADSSAARAEALGAWAHAYRAAHGGASPRVWLDALCADPFLDRQQQLAHEVVAMCRARTLLCLVSPAFVDSLGCVGRLLAWRASGGATADIAVVCVGDTAEKRRAAIAAVDAFHVLYASAAPRGAGGDAGEDAEDAALEARALVHAVRLTGVARANAEVRALLPAVQRAAERADTAAAAAAADDDVNDEATTDAV